MHDLSGSDSRWHVAGKGQKRHPTLERGVIIGAGAKVLGSFTVGEMAKVGSNAVVVKEVPAGATAVGNPARIIQKEENKAENDAASALFSSYGITPNGDDPLIKALPRSDQQRRRAGTSVEKHHFRSGSRQYQAGIPAGR